MIWRSPDKPRRIYSLGFITKGEWLAQKKIDGHCAVIIKDGDIEVRSRHNKPLNVSEDLMKELYDIGLEDGQAAVGEWTGLRKSNRIESMQLFSFLYDDFQWLGELGEEQRYDILVSRVKPTFKTWFVKEPKYAFTPKTTINRINTANPIHFRNLISL